MTDERLIPEEIQAVFNISKTKIQKDTARDIFEYIYSILFNADFENGTVEMPLMKFIKKAREYGVNLFEEGEGND